MANGRWPLRPASFGSRKSIELCGKAVPGAEDRQRKIPGFDQEIFSRSHVLCIGAGGIVSQIAPTLVRKGIGAITLVDDDIVEASNLNRQRFYAKDLMRNKATALARNLETECIAETTIRGFPIRLEEAVAGDVDLSANVAVCGVDNNPARVLASRYFRSKGIPVIFTAVSANADHGYVFIQKREGPCIGCVFPDIADDDRYPCPGTPAIADILQAVGALVVCAVDSILMERPLFWNYRRITLPDATADGATVVSVRDYCRLCRKE